MTERPILFTGEVVRAILDGRKTQTRRVMRPSNSEFGAWGLAFWEVADFSQAFPDGIGSGSEYLHVPVKPGTLAMEGVVDRLRPRFAPARCWDQKADRAYTPPASELWVRESWQRDEFAQDWPLQPAIYRADCDLGSCFPRKWKPAIHMPRWASRLTLEITNVRVERVQDISTHDIEREGVNLSNNHAGARHEFREIWDSLNAARGYGWDVNPWVWVIEFVPVPHSPHSDTLRKP